MHKSANWVASFLRREDGLTAVESAIGLNVVVMMCAGAFISFGASPNKAAPARPTPPASSDLISRQRETPAAVMPQRPSGSGKARWTSVSSRR
jgi:hypothetical protein